MNKPVDLYHPALLPADLDLVQQVALGLVFAAADCQRLPDVLDVLLARQLRHASHQHHGEEDDEQVGVMPKSEISLHTHILELLEVGAAFLPRGSHDVQEVWRENEGNPFLTDSHETLIIPQDVAKVDVEEVSRFSDHDIVVVAIPDPQNVRGYAVAAA